MITEYQIANFKAFGSPQTLPIRPITLIFGPNSSGKSSIFQSLLMLKQSIEKADNPETTLLFKGDLVDLGSFRELINHHDIDKSFSFKIRMPRPKDLEKFVDSIYLVNLSEEYLEFEEKLSVVNSLGMGIKFSYNQKIPDAFVSEISILVGDEPEPLITYEPDDNANLYFHEFLRSWLENLYGKTPKLILIEKAINTSHKYYGFIKDKIEEEQKDKLEEDLGVIDNVMRDIEKMAPDEVKKFIINLSNKVNPGAVDVLTLKNYFPDTLNSNELMEIITIYGNQPANISLLSLAIPTFIKDFLDNIFYLGPQRENPERYYTFSGNRTRYVGKSGKFVPDLLIADEELKAKVNKWFNSLLGYELKISSLSDHDTEVHELFAMRLRDKNGIHVALTDVGFGVSQVLPVIVQSVVSQGKTILIEQPEYHLHPRLQAELGDMFIESALGEQKNTFLIETHSEHLILRILRRIRETSEGTLPKGATPITPDQVSVVYVQPGPEGSQIIPLAITEDGEFTRPRPEGFFADRAQELM
jgi:AAA15 family ATPase/GTPase